MCKENKNKYVKQPMPNNEKIQNELVPQKTYWPQNSFTGKRPEIYSNATSTGFT